MVPARETFVETVKTDISEADTFNGVRNSGYIIWKVNPNVNIDEAAAL